MRPYRRLRLLLKYMDFYAVLAFLGVVLYIAALSAVSSGIELSILASFERRRQDLVEPPYLNDVALHHVLLPFEWPFRAASPVTLLGESRKYLSSTFPRLSLLLQDVPAGQLALFDIRLMSGECKELSCTAEDLSELVQAVRSSDYHPSSRLTNGAIEAVVRSAMTVWSVQGLTADMERCQQILQELFASASVQAVGLSQYFKDMIATHQLRSSGVWWSPTTVDVITSYLDKIPSNHAAARVMRDLIDAVVAGDALAAFLPHQLLLQLWLYSGSSELPLVMAYDLAVEGLLKERLRTRQVAMPERVANYTFIGASTDAVFLPIMDPLSCSFPSTLAAGVRHGAHAYQNRSSSMLYSEGAILQVAEALASTCFSFYGSPGTHFLRSPLYIPDETESIGLIPRPTPLHQHEGGNGTTRAAAAVRRSTYCGVPAQLLHSYYQLFLTTSDPMYGVWSLVVMRHDTADRCAVKEGNLYQATFWMRFGQELRSFWLLFHHMDCRIYKRSWGSRGICSLPQETLVSPATGYLNAFTAEKATASPL